MSELVHATLYGGNIVQLERNMRELEQQQKQ